MSRVYEVMPNLPHVRPLYRVIELGPFGCQMERGTVMSLEKIPTEYQVIEISEDTSTVYIEPTYENVQALRTKHMT